VCMKPFSVLAEDVCTRLSVTHEHCARGVYNYSYSSTHVTPSDGLCDTLFSQHLRTVRCSSYVASVRQHWPQDIMYNIYLTYCKGVYNACMWYSD
jgi:hypothetical protein